MIMHDFGNTTTIPTRLASLQLKMSFISFIAIILALSIIFKLYLKLTLKFCKSKTCLVGKTAIITGANTGVGYETALNFAMRGARVILACRDESRAEDAKSRIISATGNTNIVVKIINMASFESVRQFARDINENEGRLDILVNNAGVGGFSGKKSKDGRSLMIQVNYYSIFLLTHLLIDLLKKSGKSRVVNVSSLLARIALFDIDTMETPTNDMNDYGKSKVGVILFTRELAQRLRGSQVTTYSLHPGVVRTEIFRNVKGFLGAIIDYLSHLFFRTAEEGAQTQIYLSVEKDIEDMSGEHFHNCTRIAPYANLASGLLEKKLWEKTIELIGMTPEEIRI